MKTILISLSFLVFTFISLLEQAWAQAPAGNASFRIRVKDAETGKDIPNTRVYVHELRSPDKLTDDDGIVSYQLPTDRHCFVDIQKEGYSDVTIEIAALSNSTAANYKEVRLEKAYHPNKVIFSGTVEEKSGKDVPKIEVVLSFLGKAVSTRTDSFGNYRFEIPQGDFREARSYTLEVVIADCEDCKVKEDYNGGNQISKNFKVPIQHRPVTDTGGGGKINDQGLSGTWTGTLTMDNYASDFTAVLQISAVNGVITGTLRLALVADAGYYAKFNVRGSYTVDGVSFSEISVIDYGKGATFCFKQYPGRIGESNGGMSLTGRWNNGDHRFFVSGQTVVQPENYGCPGGKFTLSKFGQ